MKKFKDYEKEEYLDWADPEVFWNYHLATIDAMRKMIDDLVEKIKDLVEKIKDLESKLNKQK